MIISRVNSESVIAVQVFDQKKFKRKDQGFLGVVHIQVSSVIDLEAGGDGKQKKKSCPSLLISVYFLRDANT